LSGGFDRLLNLVNVSKSSFNRWLASSERRVAPLNVNEVNLERCVATWNVNVVNLKRCVATLNAGRASFERERSERNVVVK